MGDTSDQQDLEKASLDDVFESLGTSAGGLTAADAKTRIEKYGRNELADKEVSDLMALAVVLDRGSRIPNFFKMAERIVALRERDLLSKDDIRSLFNADHALRLPVADKTIENVVLDPDQPAAGAARIIHRSLLETLLLNEPEVRHNAGPEFLHKFRVSVRRARSALVQLEGVFPADVTAHLKTELKWLQEVTGPMRDLDVYRLNMYEYRQALPEAIRKDLDPLETYLSNHHRSEHERLVAALDSKRFHALLRDWHLLDEGGPASDEECPNARRPILGLAAERTWQTYRRVRKEGDAITDESPDEVLHALRIDCKKLRYLLEFFTSLFGPTRTVRLIDCVKLLQDNLGTFNDLSVQQEKLTSFANHMVEEQRVGAAALLAMGRLVEQLAARQTAERSRFHRSYAEFARKRTLERFQKLTRARA